MLLALLVPLALASFVFAVMLVRAAFARGAAPTAEAAVLGAVTNFFDALGIGSFAPTTAWFKFRRMVADRLLPTTLVVGHALPTMAQALIFLVLLGVAVDGKLLVGCVVAAVMGASLGVPLVARARVWVIQALVALGLTIAAILFAMTNLDMMPGGGMASSLPVSLMITAIVANFTFGILLNFGIGNYAPTLVMLSLMGMDPRLAFPIMAGAAAFAMAGAGVRHISLGEVDFRVVTGMALGGIPAVLVAAFIVKEMPIEMLRWLVVVVVLYAAIVMLSAALRGRRQEAAQAAGAAAAAR